MYCRIFASVAHLDRAAASDAACGGFESRQAHQWHRPHRINPPQDTSCRRVYFTLISKAFGRDMAFAVYPSVTSVIDGNFLPRCQELSEKLTDKNTNILFFCSSDRFSDIFHTSDNKNSIVCGKHHIGHRNNELIRCSYCYDIQMVLLSYIKFGYSLVMP